MWNASQLAQRDPALAALMGASGDGSDFGSEFGKLYSGGPGSTSFGTDYNFGAQSGMQREFGYDGMGFEFGDDAPVSGGIPKPTPQDALKLWDQYHTAQNYTKGRVRMLNPNEGSTVKIEQYLFPMSQTIVIGVATVINMTNQPDVTIRPKRLMMNAPVPGFVNITTVQVANVNVTVGAGQAWDAFFVSALGVGVALDMPTLTPSNRATITGLSTVLVPAPLVAGNYTFSAAFIGPAQMAG